MNAEQRRREAYRQHEAAQAEMERAERRSEAAHARRMAGLAAEDPNDVSPEYAPSVTPAPRPFCGACAQYLDLGPGEGGLIRCEAHRCAAFGPTGLDRAAAVTAWNQRRRA